ncbi:MAG: pyridoxal 5'-phosphate synthase glutaminase subunit PdxT [Lachnospiraceae bacterium]
MRIGVLAVQGAFIEHEMMLNSLSSEYEGGVECVELRQKEDLAGHFDGFVLPGGESTVQGKLLKELDMFDTIKEQLEAGTPVLATCAGLILLSEKISNDDNVYFGTLPVTVRRNAYGRQLGSFMTTKEIEGVGNYEMIFIRAPYVEKAAKQVQVIAEVDEKIVGVRYKNQIGLAFHPELGSDTRIHTMFLDMCAGNR